MLDAAGEVARSVLSSPPVPGTALQLTLDPAVQAAYDAPFPDASYKAGAKAFPDLIPQTLDNPATPDNQRAWEVLERFDKPFLCAFSDLDRVTAGSERAFLHKVPGAAGQPHTTLVGGGHFLQEDLGPELARVVADETGATLHTLYTDALGPAGSGAGRTGAGRAGAGRTGAGRPGT